MFLSSGKVIETYDASRKKFGEVIAEYVKKGFTGRITFRTEHGMVYVGRTASASISVELLRGLIVACRGIEGGNIVEGADCSASALKHLYTSVGTVEVVELSEDNVLLDVLTFPHAALAADDKLVTTITGAVVMMPTPPQQAPIAPPPIPKPAESPPKIEAKPVAQQQLPKPVEEVKIEELSVADECIDPLTLYTVIRSSTLLGALAEATYSDVVKKISEAISTGKTKLIYVSAAVEGRDVKMLADANTKKIYIEIESGSGGSICGSEALKHVKDSKLSKIRLWSS
jgi:hypothetical protein